MPDVTPYDATDIPASLLPVPAEATPTKRTKITLEDVKTSLLAEVQATKKKPDTRTKDKIGHGPLKGITTWNVVNVSFYQSTLKSSGFKNLADLMKGMAKQHAEIDAALKDAPARGKATTKAKPVTTAATTGVADNLLTPAKPPAPDNPVIPTLTGRGSANGTYNKFNGHAAQSAKPAKPEPAKISAQAVFMDIVAFMRENGGTSVPKPDFYTIIGDEEKGMLGLEIDRHFKQGLVDFAGMPVEIADRSKTMNDFMEATGIARKWGGRLHPRPAEEINTAVSSMTRRPS